MANINVSLVRERRSFEAGYRPGVGNTSRPLLEGEPFVNFADGVRCIGMGDGAFVETSLAADKFKPPGNNGVASRTVNSRLAERVSLFDAKPGGTTDDTLLSNAFIRAADPGVFPGLPYATRVEMPPGRPIVLDCGVDGSATNPPKGITIGNNSFLDLAPGAVVKTTLWDAVNPDGSAKYRGQITLGPNTSLRDYHAGGDGSTWLQHRTMSGLKKFGADAFNYAATPGAFQWSIDESVQCNQNGPHANFYNAFQMIHKAAGGWTGNRNGLFVVMDIGSTPKSREQINSTFQCAMSAFQSSASLDITLGGVAGAEVGAIYSTSAATVLRGRKDASGNLIASPTGILDANNGEFNLFIDNHCQVALVRSLSLAPCVAMRGRAVDCLISLSSTGSSGTGDGVHTGHRTGITFTNSNGAAPIGNDADLIGSDWFWMDSAHGLYEKRVNYQYQVANGLNFEGFAFTDSILKTQGMKLTDGALILGDYRSFGTVVIGSTNSDIRLQAAAGRFIRLLGASLPNFSSAAAAKAAGVPQEGLYLNTGISAGNAVVCWQSQA